MDIGPICWTQPEPTHSLNNPAQHFPNKQEPTQPKQLEQVQRNIIEQFYANNIEVTQTYSAHINFVTQRLPSLL